jgi:hypothetical protein
MRFATGLLLAGLLLGSGMWAIPPAHAAGDAMCSEGCEFKPIRGFSAGKYLRQDVFDEIGRAAEKLAFERHFPLILDWANDGLFSRVVQIRHTETPLRSRKWRGEFLVLIRDQGPRLRGELVRAKSPLWPQVHRYLHERHYSKIAAAFARNTLSADDPAWAAEVRRLLPSVEEVAAAREVERFAIDAKSCPALTERLRAVARLAPEPIVEAEQSTKLRIQVHPEVYEVVLANYPRLLYTTDTEPERTFFKWAEETVGTLEPCWNARAPEN